MAPVIATNFRFDRSPHDPVGEGRASWYGFRLNHHRSLTIYVGVGDERFTIIHQPFVHISDTLGHLLKR